MASIKKSLKQLWAKILQEPEVPEVLDTFYFGTYKTSWKVIHGLGRPAFKRKNIEFSYSPEPLKLPSELKDLKEKLGPGFKASGATPGDAYVLDSIEKGFKGEGPDKIPWIKIGVLLSDYYNYLAMQKNLDKKLVVNDMGQPITLRQKYLHNYEWEQPNKCFSTTLGIDLVVVTSDRQLIITKRSAGVEARPNKLCTSVSQGLRPPDDSVPEENDNTPDLYLGARNAIDDELKIKVEPEDIVILSFGVDTETSEWGFVGLVKIEKTFEQVSPHFPKANHSDEFLSAPEEGIYGIPWDYQEVISTVMRSLKKGEEWASMGLACIYHALVYEWTEEAVNEEISKYPYLGDLTGI